MNVTARFAYSKLDFYSDVNSSSPSNSICPVYNDGFMVFNFIAVLFEGEVKYANKYCSSLFKSNVLQKLIFSGITKTFLRKNYFEFISDNISSPNSLLSKGFELKFNSYYIDLNTKIIDYYLFSGIGAILLDGILNTIESNTFLNLKLELLMIQDLKLRRLMHQSIEWMLKLNQNNIEDHFHLYFVTDNDTYNFPNEDLCIFKDFSTKNKSLSVSIYKTECSCTFIWLTKTNSLKLDGIDEQKDKIIDRTCSAFNETKCNFPKLLSICLTEENLISSHKADHYNNYDLSLFLYTFEFFTSIIIQPILSLIGIKIASILSYKTLNNKIKQKELRKDLFFYAKINSIFNSGYCLIMLLSLFNNCIKDNSIYCPNFYKNNLVQYIDIYIFKYLGSTFKLASVLSELAMSYKRFRGVQELQNSLIGKKLRKNIILIVCFSLLINLIKKYQYGLHNSFDIDSESYKIQLNNSDYLMNIRAFQLLSYYDERFSVSFPDDKFGRLYCHYKIEFKDGLTFELRKPLLSCEIFTIFSIFITHLYYYWFQYL